MELVWLMRPKVQEAIAMGKRIDEMVPTSGVMPPPRRPAPRRKARTALVRRLWEIRSQIVASGEPLLDWDDLESELAERRGEREPCR
jgi:hypothetical protein